MKMLDLVLLLPVALWAVYALRSIRRGKVRCGGCGGDCSHCTAACQQKRY